MKLNLQILGDELSPLPCRRSYTDGPEVRRCMLPRVYRHGVVLEDTYVYVAQAALLPDRPPSARGAHPSIVSIGTPPAAYRDAPFNLLEFDEDIAAVDLMDRLLQIFARYDDLGEQMSRVIEGKRPLKEIGQLAMPFLGNPLYVQGASFKCLFHVAKGLNGLPADVRKSYVEEYGGGQVPLPDNSFLPLDGINELLSDPAYLQSEHTCVPLIYEGKSSPFRGLYYNIVIEGNQVARLYIDELFHRFTDRDFALIALLGDWIGRGMQDQDLDSFSRPKDIDLVLESLLAHRLVDERRIERVVASCGWNPNDSFFCMVLKSKSSDQSQMTLKTLALLLSRQLPSCCYTVFEEHLVLICNITVEKTTQDELVERLIPLFRDNLLSAGVSSVFHDFKDLFYFHDQAIKALELGICKDPSLWYFRYRDFNLENIVARCKGNTLPEALYPDGLRVLMAHDEENESDLTSLLRVYLDCNMSIIETVRATYMHRNTCMYRIKRIREISGLDLDDASVRLELQIAFAIMSVR